MVHRLSVVLQTLLRSTMLDLGETDCIQCMLKTGSKAELAFRAHVAGADANQQQPGVLKGKATHPSRPARRPPEQQSTRGTAPPQR